MERAGDLLKHIFKGKLSEKGQRYSSFFKSWKRILGKELAKNIKLVDIKKDTLLVSACHPGWMQMIQFKEKKILRYLKNQFPELGIRKLHVKLIERDIYHRTINAEKKDAGSSSLGSRKEFENTLQKLKISIENKEKERRENDS